MVMPVRAAVEGAAKVHQLNRADGTLLTPEDIAEFAISVQGGQDA